MPGSPRKRPDRPHPAGVPHELTVEIRHHGRRYAATVVLNGSTTITRDGLFLCRADWNGRALDPGDRDADLSPDLTTAHAILEALEEKIRSAS